MKEKRKTFFAHLEISQQMHQKNNKAIVQELV